MKVQGQAALVTGAGSGLGAATAIELARAGAKVALLDVNSEAANAVARGIVGKDGTPAPLADLECVVRVNLMDELPQTVRESLAASIPFPKRLGKPQEFAQLALAIVENSALNGEVIRLDGALRMAPR